MAIIVLNVSMQVNVAYGYPGTKAADHDAVPAGHVHSICGASGLLHRIHCDGKEGECQRGSQGDCPISLLLGLWPLTGKLPAFAKHFTTAILVIAFP